MNEWMNKSKDDTTVILLQKLLMLSQTALTEVLYNTTIIKNCILQWPISMFRPTFSGRMLMLRMCLTTLDSIFMAKLQLFIKQRRYTRTLYKLLKTYYRYEKSETDLGTSTRTKRWKPQNVDFMWQVSHLSKIRRHRLHLHTTGNFQAEVRWPSIINIPPWVERWNNSVKYLSIS